MLGPNKKIPKSLSECYETSYLTNNLYNWSNWLELWGEKFFILLIIIGIISTIAQSIQVAEINKNLIFLTIVTSIASWILYAFIEYCAYHVLSLLISSLATIVQNTKITANVALYTAAKDEGLSNNNPSSPTSIQNTNFSLSKLSDEKTSCDGSWICEHCKTKNNKRAIYCKYCGK